ncbi:hypothetical protein GF314_06545 [bacterium]|nr:hypothetical protein [bacterium]
MAARRPGLPRPALIPAILTALVLVAQAATAGAWTSPAADDLPRLLEHVREHGPVAPAREADARTVDWSTLRRLALLGGEFLPPYRPVSDGEISAIVRCVERRGGPGLVRAGTRRQLAALLARHGTARAPWTAETCSCRTPQWRFAAEGRASLRHLGPGEVVPGEAGLIGRGTLAVIEPDLSAWSGPLWLAATTRLEWPLADPDGTVPAALTYTGWPVPTGRPAAGTARTTPPVTRLAVPRAALGLRSGGWAVTVGLFPATVGSGLEGGGLTLADHAPSLPQLVVRRHRPLRWSSFLAPLAPAHVLVRTAAASRQEVRYESPAGRQTHTARPLFLQWLLTWNHTSWWRTSVIGTALAAPRRGESLWPDLLQVAFPLLDATWNEVDYGPVTDRLVSLLMEARWRDAPWPLLPAGAGRVWWEYGGEDFRPHGALPLVPEISAPASLVGLELVDARWDLGVEYLDTRHPGVLWYGNSGFPAGYAHDGVLLGHELGGGVRAWTGVVRWRTASGATEWVLRGRTARWADSSQLDATARRREVGLEVRRLLGAGRLRVGVARVDERTGGREDRWWQAHVTHRF